MLQTLLTWHVGTTVLLLAVYVLVAVLQWTAARLRSTPPRPPVVIPVARAEDEAVPAAAVGSAA